VRNKINKGYTAQMFAEIDTLLLPDMKIIDKSLCFQLQLLHFLVIVGSILLIIHS